MSHTIRQAIRTATQDKVVTQEEWDGIKTRAAELPKEASADARALVRMIANDTFELQGTTQTDARNLLRERGYDVPTARPADVSNAQYSKAIIASNVSEKDWAFRMMQIRAGQADQTVAVGVMDTGLDTKHAALDTKLWTNAGEIENDGIDNDGNGYVDDRHGYDFNNRTGVAVDEVDATAAGMVEGWHDEPGAARINDPHGHGTHVSGIITRGTDSVDVMGLKTLGRNFTGKMAAEAIDYAAANGAKVINMSFRVTNPSDVSAILEAMKKHPEVLFVASAGNDGRDINGYDAARYLKKNSLDNFIVTSSADQNGTKASYSNYGKPWATHADVGSAVLSTTPNGRFQAMSGTSMASPNVGAAAAKAMIMDPALTPAQVKELLADTSNLDQAHWDPLVNSGGRVDARAAYALAGLTGLVRREGLTAEQAADKLRLSATERAALLPLVPKYVDVPAGTRAA